MGSSHGPVPGQGQGQGHGVHKAGICLAPTKGALGGRDDCGGTLSEQGGQEQEKSKKPLQKFQLPERLLN